MKNKFLILAMLLMVSLTFAQSEQYNPSSKGSAFERFEPRTLPDASSNCSPIYENVQNHDDKTIVDNGTLKKFQDEMALAMKETLKDSKVTDLLEKYGFTDGMVKIYSEIDIMKIKSSQNLSMSPQLKRDLESFNRKIENYVL